MGAHHELIMPPSLNIDKRPYDQHSSSSNATASHAKLNPSLPGRVLCTG